MVSAAAPQPILGKLHRPAGEVRSRPSRRGWTAGPSPASPTPSPEPSATRTSRCSSVLTPHRPDEVVPILSPQRVQSALVLLRWGLCAHPMT
jgi:hypothetical protein